MTVQNLIDILSTIENRDVEIEKYDGPTGEHNAIPNIVGYRYSDDDLNHVVECPLDSREAIGFEIESGKVLK